MFSEDVTIKDSAGRKFIIEIETSTTLRLSFEIVKDKIGPYQAFRPHFWGGSWKIKEQGLIIPSSGDVWYRRIKSETAESLDIMLCKEGDKSQEDGSNGLILYYFLGLNTSQSSGGNGTLHRKWALSCSPGDISWDIPSRYRSA